MKKYLKAGALVVALALMGAGARTAFAYTDASATKLNDTQVDDLKLNTGNVVDSAGTTRISIGATNTVTGNLAATGNLSGVASALTGKQSFTSTAFVGVTSQSTWTIAATGSYQTVVSTGGNVFLGALPNVSTATIVGGATALPDGTIEVFASTGCATSSVYTSSVTFQDNGTLAGSRLHLGATTRSVACNKVLGLIYNAASTMWYELFYASNP